MLECWRHLTCFIADGFICQIATKRFVSRRFIGRTIPLKRPQLIVFIIRNLYCFPTVELRCDLKSFWNLYTLLDVFFPIRRDQFTVSVLSIYNTHIYTHIYTYTYTYIYTCMHKYTYIHIYTYIYTYICTYIHTYIHIYILYTYIYIHITYIYTYVYGHTCMYAHGNVE